MIAIWGYGIREGMAVVPLHPQAMTCGNGVAQAIKKPPAETGGAVIMGFVAVLPAPNERQ